MRKNPVPGTGQGLPEQQDDAHTLYYDQAFFALILFQAISAVRLFLAFLHKTGLDLIPFNLHGCEHYI